MRNKLATWRRIMWEFRAAGHIPVWRQILEMCAIYVMRRIGPGYYLMGRFGAPTMKFRDKIQFFNGRAYVRKILQLNDRLYQKTSQHKVIEAALLNYFAVPTPRSFGWFHPITGQSRSGKPLKSGEDLEALLSENDVNRFVLKPCEGFEGRGFIAAQRTDRGWLRPLNAAEAIPIDQFVEQNLSHATGYLVQDYFEQHPELAMLNSTSVNTVRMMVFRPADGAPACFGAFLRMGRNGSLVDNGASGGILANVDIESGEVGTGYFFTPSTDTFDVHPDSGARIRGKVLPLWKEAKELSCRALTAFPNLRFVGLDVAFGPETPTIIELNVLPDYGDFAVLRIPSRSALSDANYPKTSAYGVAAGIAH